MIDDLELFSTKLGKLEGFSDAGDYLVGLVQAKEVEAPKAVAPSTPATDKEEDESESSSTTEATAAKDEKLADDEDKTEDKKSDGS